VVVPAYLSFHKEREVIKGVRVVRVLSNQGKGILWKVWGGKLGYLSLRVGRGREGTTTKKERKWRSTVAGRSGELLSRGSDELSVGKKEEKNHRGKARCGTGFVGKQRRKKQEDLKKPSQIARENSLKKGASKLEDRGLLSGKEPINFRSKEPVEIFSFQRVSWEKDGNCPRERKRKRGIRRQPSAQRAPLLALTEKKRGCQRIRRSLQTRKNIPGLETIENQNQLGRWGVGVVGRG